MSVPPLLHSRLVDRVGGRYSWVVLVAGTIGFGMTVPGQTVGVSVFLDWIIGELEISRSMVSGLVHRRHPGWLVLPPVHRAHDRPHRSATSGGRDRHRICPRLRVHGFCCRRRDPGDRIRADPGPRSKGPWVSSAVMRSICGSSGVAVLRSDWRGWGWPVRPPRCRCSSTG